MRYKTCSLRFLAYTVDRIDEEYTKYFSNENISSKIKAEGKHRNIIFHKPDAFFIHNDHFP